MCATWRLFILENVTRRYSFVSWRVYSSNDVSLWSFVFGNLPRYSVTRAKIVLPGRSVCEYRPQKSKRSRSNCLNSHSNPLHEYWQALFRNNHAETVLIAHCSVSAVLCICLSHIKIPTKRRIFNARFWLSKFEFVCEKYMKISRRKTNNYLYIDILHYNVGFLWTNGKWILRKRSKMALYCVNTIA